MKIFMGPKLNVSSEILEQPGIEPTTPGFVTRRLKFYSLFEFLLYKTCGNMGLVMRKPAYCICENKDADQLRGDREADQRLYLRYMDSTIILFPKSEIASL